jgi:peptidoglycan/xylan/chitin deacetylase (PgdA/CDA1 family)
MRLDRLITLNVVQPWRRIFSRTEAPKDRGTETPAPNSQPSTLNSKSAVPILMYHNITDAPEPGIAPYYQVNTSPAVFAAHMQYLADHGFKTITISELVSLLQADSSAETPSSDPLKSQISDFKSITDLEPGRSAFDVRPSTTLEAPVHTELPKHRPLVVLTFDDGFSSVYTEAYPILKKHGFTATVYLATAFIGDTPRSFLPTGSPKHRSTEPPAHRALNSQLSTSQNCLTWPQCREMYANGIEFGSHTVSHPKLVNMSWNEIRTELADSKRTIEENLQTRCTEFCYPYAFPQANTNFCGRLQNTLCEIGYESCATTQVGRVSNDRDPFQLHRLPANTMDDEALFEAKLTGAYDWIARPQAVIKQAKAWRSNGKP